MTGPIPYTVTPRPDTGLTNPKIGIWLFLASEVMLFGAMFAAYILLRVGASSWPDSATVLDVPLATGNTVILIGSSVTMVLAWASLTAGRLRRGRLLLGATVLLGLAFLAIKAVEYADKLDHGLLPSSSPFLALYFAMTGLHALHVAAGVVVNAYHGGPGARLWHTDPRRFTQRVEVSGLFWHFVDLVWLFLFPVLYLL